MKAFSPPIRDPSDAKSMRDDLERGVCTVVRVMSPTEAELHREKLQAVMRQVRPDSDGACAATPHGGKGCSFISAYGHAQQAPVWEVRLNDILRTAMAKIYNTEPSNMAVSADNMFYWGPDAGRRKEPSAALIEGADAVKSIKEVLGSSLALHKDVGVDTHGSSVEHALRGFPFQRSLQAQINLYDVTETSAGIVLVDGDTTYDVGTFTGLNTDYCQVTPKGYAACRDKLCKPCAPAGCAIIWRSDRIHANCKAKFGEDPKRLGVFVTWHPRVLEYDRKRKLECIEKGMVGTHWPLEVPDSRSQRRWKRAGSHMSNGDGLSKIIAVEFTDELRDRVREAI